MVIDSNENGCTSMTTVCGLFYYQRKMTMVYLNVFTFPNEDMEFNFFMSIKRTCYDSFYPFKILSRHG